jgi:hypothetical protein
VLTGPSSFGSATTVPLSLASLNLAGQSTCTVSVTGTGTPFSLQPQVSANTGVTYVANNIPAITAAGIYTIPLNGSFTNFQATLTAAPTTGLVNVTYNCSNANVAPVTPTGTAGAPAGPVTSVQTPLVTQAGTLGALNAVQAVSLLAGQQTCTAVVSGIPAGMTITAKQSIDGVNYVTDNAFGSYGAITANGQYFGACAGQSFELVVSAYTSGSASVTLNAAVGTLAYASFVNSLGTTSANAPDKSVPITITTSGGKILAVAAVGTTTQIFVAQFTLGATGTSLTYSWGYAATGTCVSGTPTVITPPMPFASAASFTVGSGLGQVLAAVPVSDDLCLTIGGTVSTAGGAFVTYAQHP